MVSFPKEERDDQSNGPVLSDSSKIPSSSHGDENGKEEGEREVHVKEDMMTGDDVHVAVWLEALEEVEQCRVELIERKLQQRQHDEVWAGKDETCNGISEESCGGGSTGSPCEDFGGSFGGRRVPESSDADQAKDVNDEIKDIQDELRALRADNGGLHSQMIAGRHRRRSMVDADMLEGQNFLYMSNLARWAELKDELEQLRLQYRNQFDEMHDKLDAIRGQAQEHEEGLIRDLWRTAREAQSTVTGQILSDAVLTQLEERYRAATREVSKVRILARQLRSHLAKLESTKRKKDQLPGGLHLVDFEQLKMETESLAEKIISKNEEIELLRKKKTTVVHTLAHVKEKLQQTEKQMRVANAGLDDVETDLHKGRIELCGLKARCEAIVRKKGNMQRSMVNIADPMLLDDLENLKEYVEATKEANKELKSRFKVLNDQYNKFNPLKIGTKEFHMNGLPCAESESEGSSSNKHDLRWGENRERMWRQSIA